MSRPDSTASAALGEQIIRPVFFCYLDVVGDPLRACTAGKSYAFTGTGDPDLDGHTFDGIDPTFVDVGAVQAKDGGSPTVECKLSGIVNLDTTLLNIIGNAANWQGRVGRLWRMIRDADGNQQGVLQPYYTGYMTALHISGDPINGQNILLSIESYLAAYSHASNRTYQDADTFDPGDLSAKAAIAITNGNSSNSLVSNTPVYANTSGAGDASGNFGSNYIPGTFTKFGG